MKRSSTVGRCALIWFALACALPPFAGCAGRRQAVLQPSTSFLKTSAARQPQHTPDSPPSDSIVQLASSHQELEPNELVPPPVVARSSSQVVLEPHTIEESLRHAEQDSVAAIDQQTISLDLTSALSMVSGQSPVIAYAAARYQEAYARLDAARAMWLPSIRTGLSYHHHDGNLQASSGEVLDVDRSSFQGGLGVSAVGAGTTPTPGVEARFHTSDALYQPRIADQAALARGHAVDAATNDALLRGSLAYLELLRAEQLLAVAKDTLANAEQLADLTARFAKVGQGSEADADRAKTEYAIRTNDKIRAEEAVSVANARLLEALSLDPQVRVVPTESTIVPVDLIDPEIPTAELLAIGLSSRPELAEARHLVCEAVQRYRREKMAPLLPSVVLGISQTGFGGARGGDIDSLRRRFDFDAVAYWEIRNFGCGERAARDATRSVYEQQQYDEVRLMDRVAREINESHTQIRSRKRQIAIAETAVAAAKQSYERNSQRITNGVGLPLETLQSLHALDQARREYVRTVADYNEAQFHLQRAVGWAIR